MTRRLKPGLFSLQTQLVISMTGLILMGVIATGIVFVLRSKAEHEEQALQRVAAAAPGFFQMALPTDAVVPDALTGQASVSRFVDFVDKRAAQRGLRVLLVGDAGEVIHDSGGSLEGTTVTYPLTKTLDEERGYVAWEPGSRASDFTFVASAGPPEGDFAGRPMPFMVPPLGAEGQPAPFGMVLGVETRKIENAWLSALPGVGIAAGIVTPFAVLLAVVLARQIARPVHQLTSASEAMARGDFEQRVEVERQDEVGRLAKAFSVMAERVGERDAQMRALIANVSHDLKTPMTSIIGYAQALRDGVTDDTKRAAETIQRQATVAHELLADLLFLSEIDSGQSVRMEGEATAREIVEAAALRLQPVMEAKAIRLSLEVDETAIIAGVDAQRVVRALTNVLDNAVRFSAEGEVVRVSAVQEGGSVRLEVENRGPRISEEDLPHVLERFYRGTSGGYGGHGLGLAIAKEAIELNGGRIRIENVETGVRVIISFAAG